MRLTGNRTSNNQWGKTSVGLVYRFDSRRHVHGDTRTITRARLGGPHHLPAVRHHGVLIPGPGARGAGVYNAQAYLDLAVTHDFPLFKVAGKDVTAFGKIVIGQCVQPPAAGELQHRLGEGLGAYGTPTGGVNSRLRPSTFVLNPRLRATTARPAPSLLPPVSASKRSGAKKRGPERASFLM